jgi:hypothetical protein
MGTCQSGNLAAPSHEVAITDAAIAALRQLVGALTGRVATHGYRDGGLICEDRTSRGRPRMWRIGADGGLLPDSSYNYADGAFVSTPVPGQAVAR